MTQFIIGVVLGVLGMGLVSSWVSDFSARRDSDTIRDAANMEIGDGVTLSEGLKAYFGGDTRWGLIGTRVARAEAGMNRPAATVYACPKDGDIRIICPLTGGAANKEQIKTLLAIMVQQAKAKKTVS